MFSRDYAPTDANWQQEEPVDEVKPFDFLLSLLKTRFERIDDVVRQGLDTRQCLRIARLAVCRARLSRAKRASAPHCNRKRISKGFVEDARR